LIETYLRPWSGEAVRHIPEGPYDPLDFRWAGRAGDNRWNATGQSTLYLARDRGVALAEMARHLRDDRVPLLARQANRRQVYRFTLAFEYTLDLTNPEVCRALSITDAPLRFLHKSAARATAQFIRELTPAEALFVPSAAFLDRPEAWVLVVFLEKLPKDPKAFISAVTPDGVFAVEP
jgi:RES domain-containing protein